MTSRWREVAAWLREELAPRPGRLAGCLRVAAGCAITVMVAMVFEIPLPAYSAYIVLLLSREEYIGTLIGAVGGATAATAAVLLSLAFFMVDASEPALRIPLMAASTFLAMFLSRTSTIGPIAFLAGFVLVLTQTLVDVVPSAEILVHLVLWLWVVAVLPAMLTTLIDLIFGISPGKLALQTALHLLDESTEILRGHDAREIGERQGKALELFELRKHAQIADRRLRAISDIDHRLIDTLIELLTLLRALPSDTPREVRESLADASSECTRALASNQVADPPQRPLPDALVNRLRGDVLPIVMAIDDALGRLRSDIALRYSGADVPSASSTNRTSLVIPDAWSNPEHAHFALKTTIAVMASYFIYTMLDWPGIRTAVTTCFFVALTSLGETMHKLTLRLAGALIGGAIAILSIVYVLPHMTDIGQVALLIFAIAAISAWVAASSERLSYFGLQIAFAFFNGILQDYGPTTDLTTARDRVVGILLGNVVMTIVFSVMWPTSALDRARQLMARALSALGELLRSTSHPQVDARLAAVKSVTEARHFVSIAAFETHLLQRARQRETFEESAIGTLDRLAAAAFVVAAQPARGDIGAPVRMQDATASAWFADAAHRFAAGEAPVPPDRATLDADVALLPASSSSLRAAIDARVFLQREMEHVAKATV